MTQTEPHLSTADQEAIARRLGYTEREARFLVLVARHGGYFLRRQFCDFAGITKGRTDVAFTRQLVARRHASVHTFCHAAQVFHLATRELYAPDLEPSTTARRRRPALAIKPRLMALDVALARPNVTFLATESERLRFCESLGATRASIPARLYHPHHGTRPVTRYFTEQGLIGAEAAHTLHPLLVLAYIDEGARSHMGLRTFLRRYAPLLTQVPRWKVIYACESPQQAAAATRVFRQDFGDDTAAFQSRRLTELRDYCELRVLYDGRRWSELTTARLEHFFDLKQTLGGFAESVFPLWQEIGERAFARALEATHVVFPDRFDPLVLPHSYAAVSGTRSLR
jgi:hypothetical protein